MAQVLRPFPAKRFWFGFSLDFLLTGMFFGLCSVLGERSETVGIACGGFGRGSPLAHLSTGTACLTT